MFRTIYFFITITVIAVSHPQVLAQEVTSQALPPVTLADGPDSARFPTAEVLPPTEDTTKVVIESDLQSERGGHYVLDGNVVVTYGNRKVEADHIEYDTESGEVTATGHVKVTGGKNDEIISASHGSLNVKTQTGRFYDVTGSVGMKNTGHRVVYANGNPFLFSGRMVVKTGPQEYEVYDGTVTSCQLPHPDWLLYAGKFTVDAEKARASNSVFRLLNVPLLYLPYVTQPVDATDRQSGFLIPVIGESSTKGLVLGEQLYWVINRSTDFTVGGEYYSLRGWAQSAMFRYRGLGDDFVTARYSGLLDRGYTTGGVYVNQGGQDVTFSGRHDVSSATRLVADVEYLSSYPYREAFAENFNQAVSTDILSVMYGVHEAGGYELSGRADRYQGLKKVPVGTTAGEEVKIFHVPSLDLSTTDHALGATGIRWNVGSSAAGLKRVEPKFVSAGIMERFDLHPQVSYPLSAGGWHLLPSAGVRETVYSRSRKTQGASSHPVESTDPLNRTDFEAQAELRAPVIERTFDTGAVKRLFGGDVKHSIEPVLTYRYVSGVNNFKNVPRFDGVDVVSDTNELEYGVTQRLFLRPAKERVCTVAELDASTARLKDDGDVSATAQKDCGSRELISWRLAQKYFFDESFGGAVVKGRRNILDTTLSFSGVAFLTEPRAISPLTSRMRMRASEKVDLEWDFDLDTGAKKFTSNNVLVDVHEGNTFAGLSYARLNAPGRSYTEGTPSAESDFSQLRILLGYGTPSKRGLGVAANAGLDLNLGTVQYGALQTSYNWDCCGFSVEYRKYELGSVRNENSYRFNFTLANIGTAGNLRRAERLF
jgi:LPS-assembly protein